MTTRTDPWPLAIVDTETTGLDPDRHPVWEVAIILYDPATHDTEEHVRQITLTPEQIAAADPAGIAVSGFNRRYDPDEAAPPGEVLAWVVGAIGTAHIVGAIPSFDEERLRRACLALGFRPRWHYHLIDVEALAVGYLHGLHQFCEAIPVEEDVRPPLPWKSDDLSRAVGVEPPAEEERHTALGDARHALRLYQAVTDPLAPAVFGSPCPSRSVVTDDPCSLPDSHKGLHRNEAGTQEWVDQLLDDFPNGVVVHGLEGDS